MVTTLHIPLCVEVYKTSQIILYNILFALHLPGFWQLSAGWQLPFFCLLNRPIARPWTQWVQQHPVWVHICLYMYIMLYYTHTHTHTHTLYTNVESIKSTFVRTKKLTLSLHTVLYYTTGSICTHIFLRMIKLTYYSSKLCGRYHVVPAFQTVLDTCHNT